MGGGGLLIWLVLVAFELGGEGGGAAAHLACFDGFELAGWGEGGGKGSSVHLAYFGGF